MILQWAMKICNPVFIMVFTWEYAPKWMNGITTLLALAIAILLPIGFFDAVNGCSNNLWYCTPIWNMMGWAFLAAVAWEGVCYFTAGYSQINRMDKRGKMKQQTIREHNEEHIKGLEMSKEGLDEEGRKYVDEIIQYYQKLRDAGQLDPDCRAHFAKYDTQ